MKFSISIALLAATLAPTALAKSAANKFPVIKREHLSSSSNKNSLGSLLSNAATQNPVIIILWQFAGGNSQTTELGNTQTITQTVSVPGKAVATSSATETKKDAAVTTSASSAASTTTAATGTGSVAAGATHMVIVGGSQGLSYFPQSVNAAVGDVIQFEFQSQNHTVTQSTFDTPCAPLAGGINSGFMPNPNNTVNPAPAMAMQVMTTDPLWMYCAQGNHCGRGMVFSINPSAAKTHAQFQARAINSTGKGLVGSNLTGGTAVPSVGAPAATGAAGANKGTVGTSTGIAAPSSVQTGVVTGTGTLQADGSCLCSVQCGAGSFPAAAQGIGAFGGTAGSISMAQAAGVLPASSRRLRRRFW